MQFKKLALGVIAASVGAFGLSSAAFAGDPIAVGVSAEIKSGVVTDLNAATAVGPNAAANATTSTVGSIKVNSANAAASENVLTVNTNGTTGVTQISGSANAASSLENDKTTTPDGVINSVFGTPVKK